MTALELPTKTRPIVGAYYFPGYHADATTGRWHGAGWTEWEVMAAARPRFPGHRQPRISEWGEFDESDPIWARAQAEAAVAHGIDLFLFDWYWYEGGPFLNSALDRGFLAVPGSPLQFALMWANHDWLNVHPAAAAATPNVLLTGAVSDRQFDDLAAHVVDRYFAHDRYFRPGGAPYFSIYEPQTLVEGFGSISKAARAIERLRMRAARMGFPDLHLNLVVTDRAVLPGERRTSDLPEIIRAFGAASTTSYVWIHHYDPAADGFPRGNYTNAAQANERVWRHLRDRLEVPYFPNVTVGWDSSPRTTQSDRYESRDYPWMAVLDGTPAEYERALGSALEFAAESTSDSSLSLVTINAWNEWTEGSYLLPDSHHGNAFLRATRDAVQRAVITSSV